MKYRVQEVSGSWVPVFPTDDPESWLRASYLRDTEGFAEEVLDLISQARKSVGKGMPALEWSHNEIWLEVYSDRAVIIHQWIFDPDGSEEEIVIPIDEAESLLRDWQSDLSGLRRLASNNR